MKHLAPIVVSSIVLLGAAALRAEVTLPSHFSDHMIFQREMRVPVWGTAAPGETVTVEFAGQKKSVQVGAQGQWGVELDPMPAGSLR
jgi:sialate O-acetylesterase